MRRVLVITVQAGVVGFEIGEEHPGVTPATPAIRRVRVARLRSGVDISLKPRIVFGRSADQGSLECGDGTRHHISIELPIKPLL